MDPLHFCIAIAPLSVYLLMLGMLIGLTIPNIRWKKKRSSMSGISVDF